MKTINFQFNRRIALVVIVAIMVAFSWLAPLDSAATERVDSSLKRALVSYGTARALNAVISFAQGTELSFQPLGVGLNLAPGQILDPLNDLVEQLSEVLLIASVALGIQKILLLIGANWLISLAFTVISSAWCVLHLRQQPSPGWLSKLLLILLLTRFAIPVSAVGTDILFQSFMAPSYTASQTIIENTSIELDKAPVQTESSTTDGSAAKPGLWTRLVGKVNPEPSKDAGTQAATENSTSPVADQPVATQNAEEKRGFFDKVNPKKKFESFKQAAEKSIEHMIQLMVVFVLDTVVLPIFLIWVLISVGRGAFVTPRELQGQ